MRRIGCIAVALLSACAHTPAPYEPLVVAVRLPPPGEHDVGTEDGTEPSELEGPTVEPAPVVTGPARAPHDAPPSFSSTQRALLVELQGTAAEIWLSGHVYDYHEPQRVSAAERARGLPRARRLLARVRTMHRALERGHLPESQADSLAFFIEETSENLHPEVLSGVRAMGRFALYETVMDTLDELVNQAWWTVDGTFEPEVLQQLSRSQRCSVLRSQVRVELVQELDEPREELANAREALTRELRDRAVIERQIHAVARAARGALRDGRAAERRFELALEDLDTEGLEAYFRQVRVAELSRALDEEPLDDRHHAWWLVRVAQAADQLLRARLPLGLRDERDQVDDTARVQLEEEVRDVLHAARSVRMARGRSSAMAAEERLEDAIERLGVDELNLYFAARPSAELESAIDTDVQTEHAYASWVRRVERTAAAVLRDPRAQAGDSPQAVVTFYEQLLREWSASEARGAAAWQRARESAAAFEMADREGANRQLPPLLDDATEACGG